jgi:hypothetical protein
MQPLFQSTAGLCSVGGFLLVYGLIVALTFRANKYGLKRRWLPLDYVWVPLGGLTGVFLLALWWRFHATM